MFIVYKYISVPISSCFLIQCVFFKRVFGDFQTRKRELINEKMGTFKRVFGNFYGGKTSVWGLSNEKRGTHKREKGNLS